MESGINKNYRKEKIKMAKVTFDENLCKGCGLCVGACPKKIVKLKTEINVKGYHPACVEDQDSCIGCAFCATMCPDCVITVEK
jgi:2-oxoglutarate ferredoxin oxidoreductase subunit delta